MNMLANWSQAAPGWVAHHTGITRLLAPVTRAMLESAAPREGMHILDVAGGTGEPTLSLASVVGAAGRVQYTDPVEAMVECAAARVRESGLPQVRCTLGRAEQLPVEAASFDQAWCRFGLMFFENKVEGLRQMLQALKPGGTLCVAVWGDSAANPFFSIPMAAVTAFVEDVDQLPPDPALSTEDPALLRGLLQEAGAETVTVRTVDFFMEGELGFAPWWTMRVDMSPTLLRLIEGLDDIQQEMAQDKAHVSLREYFTPQGFRLPARALVAVARRPL